MSVPAEIPSEPRVKSRPLSSSVRPKARPILPGPLSSRGSGPWSPCLLSRSARGAGQRTGAVELLRAEKLCEVAADAAGQHEREDNSRQRLEAVEVGRQKRVIEPVLGGDEGWRRSVA